MTFTDPLVAQKVVNMQHTIRKSNINVSFADPKGGTSKSHFPAVNPFGLSLHYPPAHHIPRHQAPGSRYPYSTQSQQAFALGFGQNQQVAISRPAGIQDPHSSSSMVRGRRKGGGRGRICIVDKRFFSFVDFSSYIAGEWSHTPFWTGYHCDWLHH